MCIVAIITKFAIKYTIANTDTAECLHEKFVPWVEVIRISRFRVGLMFVTSLTWLVYFYL